ncbi:hypothetical protein FRC05_007916 [Tulasnella sp. 425]|nr:hypothetical protein FRC05_007916 [Tulasnella sp. 425]
MYEVTIGFGDRYKFCIGKPLISISCDAFSPDHFQETFIWLSGHLKMSLPDTPLHLELKGSEPKPSYLEWFTRHTNVTALTLCGNPFIENSLEEIMPILGRPRSAPHSPPTWLFPQVEVFQANIVRMEGDPAIVDMVEGRHAASRGSPTAEVNRVIPKRFREIRLEYGRKVVPRPLPDAGFMLKVVQVADGADVYWEGKKWIVS